MRAVVLASFLWVVTAACGDNVRGNITIYSEPEFALALTELAALTPHPGVRYVPGTTYAKRDAFSIVVVEREDLGPEMYELDPLEAPDHGVMVIAGGVLGAQYGTAAALEALGFRFRHPFDAYVPRLPELDETMLDYDKVYAPYIRVRGFQLHTLHPIEASYAFWEPSPGSFNDAKRIIDWVIKNRGNYVQWTPVDNIMDPAQYEPWKAHTRAILDYAHARGVRLGINVQLFGQSNLQLAFDLADDRTGTVPVADEIASRLPLITTDLPFDVYDLSFGEFFNAEPERFLDAINEVERQLDTLAPQAELHAFVHVGATQRIDYMGENFIYYFLVKYADPEIIPDIHTVMFYNLFETASGAYHHEDFAEHRAYLEEKICAGEPHAYVPETAYWVAFDNSVPQYFPLYVHNRWLDLDQLRDTVTCGTLDNHTLFSTGWEWGYWLHDVTALRASYELPESPTTLIEHAFSPDLSAAVPPVVALIDLQRDYLHQRGLVAYLIGRDAVIDAGRELGIVSQPDRITHDDLVVTGQAQELATTVLAPLAEYADAVEELSRTVAALELPSTRWGRELRDDFAITALRPRFVLATYQATIAHLDGQPAQPHVDDAEAILAEAREVVLRRHADLHDTHGRRLLERSSEAYPNHTFYPFGYLFMADTLCYWERELAQVRVILGSSDKVPPSCVF